MTRAAGIGAFVRRFSHVVVNVTDLERSVAFYEAVSTFLGHGYVKLAITYPDVAPKRAQLAAAGAELTNAVTVRNYLSIVDPDGVIISFLQADASPTERLYHTCLSTISVEETTEFYRDVIGLDHWMRATVPSPVPASQGPGPDVAQFDSNFFRAFGDRRFQLDCSMSLLVDTPEPSTPPANQAGISRVAIEVADIDACHAALSSLCVDRAFGPLGDVVTVQTGNPIGDRRVCYLTDPNGHLLELFEPCARTFVSLRPDGD